MNAAIAMRVDAVRRLALLGELFPHLVRMGAGHHHSRHGRGPGAGAFWGPWPGRFGSPFGGFGPPWRGGKARRGDVRNAILAVLAEQALNGYQVIQEIADRSGGVWRPSPGSVYPTLQQLEDEGLVHATEREGRRVFELSDEGRTYVAEHAAELAAAWESVNFPGGEAIHHVRSSLGQLMAAVAQVAAAGTPAQQAAAREILDESRRRLYRLLADEDTRRSGGGDGA